MSFVLNDVLFAMDDFKCGCRCSAYTTPDGFQTFTVTDVRFVLRAHLTCVHLPAWLSGLIAYLHP